MKTINLISFQNIKYLKKTQPNEKIFFYHFLKNIKNIFIKLKKNF